MSQKKYNIFISYGWADNKSSGAGTAGWVSTFVDRMRKHLDQQLYHHHGIGAFVPLSALPDKTGLKSSDITRDLREKLKVCSAVLMVYKDGPVHQIHRRITEFLKVTPQRPKGRPDPTLAMCRPADGALPPGLYLPQILDCPCGSDCAADCARCFAEGPP